MRPTSALKTILGISLFGVMFSGVLTYKELFGATALNCPAFGAPGTLFGYPACVYGFFVYVTAFSMILPFTFYYVVLFMWWYTVRARQTRARMTGGEVEIPKAKTNPKPARDEKAAKATAFTCTNCGADVNETDEKCPKCGAVFEE